jgi:hypothetical protein
MNRLRLSSSLCTAAIAVLLLAGCEEDCSDDPLAPSCVADYEPTAALLNVVPIAQQTQLWCWAASAEMLFRYYSMPNLNPFFDYQCGVVGVYYYLVGGPAHPCVSNCYLCQTGAGTLTEVQRIVNGYGDVAHSGGFASRDLRSRIQFSALTLQQLAKELDEGRPVLAGISPQGITLPNISQHAVILVGYDTGGPAPVVYVNDPFPYMAFFQQDPYTMHGGGFIAPGRYVIRYDALVSLLRWGNSLHDIR